MNNIKTRTTRQENYLVLIYAQTKPNETTAWFRGFLLQETDSKLLSECFCHVNEIMNTNK